MKILSMISNFLSPNGAMHKKKKKNVTAQDVKST